MRTITIIFFYSIVLAVYLLANYYIFIRGWQALPPGSRSRTIFLSVFLILSISYVAGRIMESFWLGPPSSYLIWIGSFWLGAMLYLFLILLLIDIVRLLNLAFPIIPQAWRNDPVSAGRVLFNSIAIIIPLIIAAGHINTWYPKTNRIEVNLNGKNSEMSSVNMVLVSDIHLGTLTPRHRILKMVERINALDPDIILLAGDILDEDVGPVIQRDLGGAIRKLRAPLGVYGVTGNHEFIGGVEQAARYITEHGVELLRDTVIRVNNSFYLAGREDLVINRFTDKTRKDLEELLSEVNNDLPLILMDHQPFGLEKSAAAGVHFKLSGHTHHGQLWPLNFITRAVYRVSRGLDEVDGMKVYVSNGIGTWGPPLRIGSRPEIVYITVNFKK